MRQWLWRSSVASVVSAKGCAIMTAPQRRHASSDLPHWVPAGARHYLVHTETGLSIRALGRASDCHPSTVLRQVRRIEGPRDDPLVDAALRSLSAQVSAREILQEGKAKKMKMDNTADLIHYAFKNNLIK